MLPYPVLIQSLPSPVKQQKYSVTLDGASLQADSS